MLSAATLDIGHRVRIGHSVRPLYLHGRTGTITAWAGKSTVVVLDKPVGPYVTARCGVRPPHSSPWDLSSCQSRAIDGSSASCSTTHETPRAGGSGEARLRRFGAPLSIPPKHTSWATCDQRAPSPAHACHELPGNTTGGLRMQLHLENYPFGKAFAVSFVDDTDGATLEQITPVYRSLAEHGVRVTKTVWPLPAVASSGWLPTDSCPADTLARRDYLEFCQNLQDQGNEIALHTASGGDNDRGRTEAAYEFFDQAFGRPPATNIMHGRNRENIYWGKDAFIGHPSLQRATRLYERQDFYGHVPGTRFYWGDICRSYTRYVRLFETRDLNTLSYDPATPYHDPNKPDVNWWFSSTYAAGDILHRTVTEDALRSLRAARGASILHVYAKSYSLPGPYGRPKWTFVLSPSFRRTLETLASFQTGWYVPAVVLLDRLRAIRQLDIRVQHDHFVITNRSDVALPDLAIKAASRETLLPVDRPARALPRNGLSQVCLGNLKPGQAVTFRVLTRSTQVQISSPSQPLPNYHKLFRGTARRVSAQFLQDRERLRAYLVKAERHSCPNGLDDA